jgi:hypothetical protein
MTIDRALSGIPFSVDQFRCRDAAEKLRGFSPRRGSEAWSTAAPLSQLVFKTLFVSICHQFNWDFLQSAMAQWILPHPEDRLVALASTSPQEIAKLLSDYEKPERVRASERAEMLRTTAVELRSLLTSGQLETLISNRRLDGAYGYYEVMRSISAFRTDELEKKVRVLAHDLHREEIIVFADPNNLRPAVEYHILRLYLRSGRVYPTNEAVRQHLLSPATPSRARLVHTLRRTVEEAMNLTALYSGLDVATLNYVEWQIGRSVCTPEKPNCTRPSGELPADIASLSPDRCVFVNFCRSFNEPQYGWFHEPHFQKAIY